MNSLAFFDDKNFPKDLIKCSNSFILDNVKLNVGVIEEKNTKLLDSDKYSQSVLVKKKAFSCSYRDKQLIFYTHKKIVESGLSNDIFFSHIGSEFVGEVVQLGKEVRNLKLGDKVIPNVSYPSHKLGHFGGIPTNGASKRLEVFHCNNLLKVPSDIPDTILAAFPTSSFTAYSMVRKVLEPNAKVLVTAAKSNTSLAVINALKSREVEIYVISSNNSFKKELLELGVRNMFCFDFENGEFENSFLDFVKEIGGFDVIIDPFFDVYFSNLANMLANGGKYITCGLLDQSGIMISQKRISLNELFVQLMVKNISISGNCLGSEWDGIHALNELKSGKYQVLVDSVYGFGEEHLFFQRTFNSRNRFGKVVYEYQDKF
jgi:NADPH:quinone reductase-like Zn-dependent oxidoreductase